MCFKAAVVDQFIKKFCSRDMGQHVSFRLLDLLLQRVKLRCGEKFTERSVIFNPSQSFLIVATLVLLFLPLTILFMMDCVIPLMLHSLLMEIPRILHSSMMRLRTASPTLIDIISSSFSKNDTHFVLKRLTQMSCNAQKS